MTPDRIYYTPGLNMNCRPVVCEATLVEVFATADEHGRDCIIKSDGIRILSKRSDLYDTRAQALDAASTRRASRQVMNTIDRPAVLK